VLGGTNPLIRTGKVSYSGIEGEIRTAAFLDCYLLHGSKVASCNSIRLSQSLSLHTSMLDNGEAMSEMLNVVPEKHLSFLNTAFVEENI
jgi:hypothetical protein